MTPDERERLAALIAAELLRTRSDVAHTPAEDNPGERRGPAGSTWLPVPVRPEPPARGAEPPVWSGASQSLGDVAPGRAPAPSPHRADLGEVTAAVRAAAAGQHAPPTSRDASPAGAPRGHADRSARRGAAARLGRGDVIVPVGVSRRHVHLSEEHVRALFGVAALDVARHIRQPGQFAAVQCVDVEGPSGTLARIRVVGPARSATQLELARSDALRLGIDPPLAASGALEESLGGVTLVGPNGRVSLERGVIVAARHLHASVADAARWGMRDGDRLDIRCGEGARAVTWHDVLVRSGPAHATEFHLDEDEAHAAGVTSADTARIVGWREQRPTRRTLVTERDVVELARRGGALPHGALLTPAARDRARALGLDTP
ncbi:MAG: hypothetical protein IT359_06775 [Gemmatimonadaceae bacterium]|nr:hypothetical protein [Gemmatimonadaceae bacterium]